MPSEVELTLSGMAYGGDAFGRLPDGRAVFVPFALPGERVLVRLVEEKRGFARAALIRVLHPALERITPRCVHFGVCGGCQYQHIAYSHQLTIKEAIFREQLQRIGQVTDPPVRPIVPSPAEWYYRNIVQFHLAEAGRLGYLAAGSHTVIPIVECFLPEEPLNDLWPRMDFQPDPIIERISLRVGIDEEMIVVIESSEPAPPEFAVDFPISAVHLGPTGAVVLSGDEALFLEVLGRTFRVSPGSFFQVNTPQAAAMVEHLLARLPLSPDATLLDVYCGVGLFSAFFASRVGQLAGVELSEPAGVDFAANLDEFDNVSLYQGAAEDVLPSLDIRPDVVVVDPPRAGLERRALDALVRLAPQVLAYVSCDPATLARDARRLITAGYTLEEATPFDLFPQTAHIESICIFSQQ